MAINKVIYGGETLIDLTSDTVTADKILSGFTAHDKGGEPITGTCEYDVDSSDATAAVAEILQGKTAYVRGQKLTGTMKNNGAVTGTISSKDEEYTIPQGHHDGSGKVSIADAEKAKLIPDNIREGITLLGSKVLCLVRKMPNHRQRLLRLQPKPRQFFQILMKDTITCPRLQSKQFPIRKARIPLEVLR